MALQDLGWRRPFPRTVVETTSGEGAAPGVTSTRTHADRTQHPHHSAPCVDVQQPTGVQSLHGVDVDRVHADGRNISIKTQAPHDPIMDVPVRLGINLPAETTFHDICAKDVPHRLMKGMASVLSRIQLQPLHLDRLPEELRKGMKGVNTAINNLHLVFGGGPCGVLIPCVASVGQMSLAHVQRNAQGRISAEPVFTGNGSSAVGGVNGMWCRSEGVKKGFSLSLPFIVTAKHAFFGTEVGFKVPGFFVVFTSIHDGKEGTDEPDIGYFGIALEPGLLGGAPVGAEIALGHPAFARAVAPLVKPAYSVLTALQDNVKSVFTPMGHSAADMMKRVVTGHADLHAPHELRVNAPAQTPPALSMVISPDPPPPERVADMVKMLAAG